jgi:restriction endonuclease S subunit
MAEQVSSLKTTVKYKDTTIGRIPVDWEVTSLSNMAEITMGQSPDSKDCNDQGEGYPLYQGNAEFGMIYPFPKNWCTKGKKIADKGDILIRVRAPVGEVNIAPHKCCIGRGIASIKAKDVNGKFLYQSMLLYRKALKKIAQGSAFDAINSKELSGLFISLPPIIEQKKIAEILTTVDKAIEKATRIIEKTKELKKGLTHKLLTKGIGHRRFKKTEIGEIPDGWEVCKLGELCIGKPGYGANTPAIDKTHNMPILPQFLFHVTHSLRYHNWVKEILMSGAQLNINDEEYSSMLLPIPPIEEQKKISEILTSINDEIEQEIKHKEKLELLKEDLMKLLLIGKLRVME